MSVRLCDVDLELAGQGVLLENWGHGRQLILFQSKVGLLPDGGGSDALPEPELDREEVGFGKEE